MGGKRTFRILLAVSWLYAFVGIATAAVGAAAGAWVGDTVRRHHASEVLDMDLVMVIVTARELQPGHQITEEDLYAVQIPPRFLPEGVYLSPEYVVGRRVAQRVLPNELVRAGRLIDE